MPSPKSNRRGNEEKNRRGRLTEKASSFHGKSFAEAASQLRRPKTLPDLLPSRSLLTTSPSSSSEGKGRPIMLTKILLNVTIQGSVGAVQVLISLESTVGDLIAAALSQHAKEGRRPNLVATDPSRFNLHYSQFSLECLDRKEQVKELGSRNFFMCPSKTTMVGAATTSSSSSSSSSCATEADKVSKNGFSWLKFMDFKL
ncbi:uncharacterized protein At4g22758-like [Humulus lupulus]|uniref:uncharacterized protein At4g22758-like n=1 Tax=Humulus lupulus TaxID=3486 RepID=UPI002B4178B5|nr:uncharacterized protein At4g22758-like [Humulus lupulus]